MRVIFLIAFFISTAPNAQAQDSGAAFFQTLGRFSFEPLKAQPWLFQEPADNTDPSRPRILDLDILGVPSIPNRALRPVDPGKFPVFSDDMDKASLLKAINFNAAFLNRFPDSQPLYFGERVSTVGQLKKTLAAVLDILDLGPEERAKRLREDFEVFESVGSNEAGKVVFTAYFDPEIPGTTVKDAAHPVAIYGTPSGLTPTQPTPNFPYDYARKTTDGSLQPFPSRAEIDNGALEGEKLELAWSEDPTDLAFVQLQGSGLLRLPDGKKMRLHFSGANGHPWRSVARYLIERGEIPSYTDSLSLFRYIRSQPEKRKYEILQVSPRYGFFSVGKAGSGPYGGIGVPLTTGRSIAVSREMPKGCLAFFITKHPVADDAGNITGYAPARRFALTQDAGAAINNPGRVDIFWGEGNRAAVEASHMMESGQLYFLLLK